MIALLIVMVAAVVAFYILRSMARMVMWLLSIVVVCGILTGSIYAVDRMAIAVIPDFHAKLHIPAIFDDKGKHSLYDIWMRNKQQLPLHSNMTADGPVPEAIRLLRQNTGAQQLSERLKRYLAFFN